MLSLFARMATISLQAIELVHRQLHALADELLELNTLGRSSEALERLGELYDLRDDLLKKLKNLELSLKDTSIIQTSS